MAKINPRRRPATAADVNRAWEQGVLDGVTNACAIFMTVLVDKFDGGPHIPDVWREVNKLSEEIKENRVSIADLKHVLATEYDIHV